MGDAVHKNLLTQAVVTNAFLHKIVQVCRYRFFFHLEFYLLLSIRERPLQTTGTRQIFT